MLLPQIKTQGIFTLTAPFNLSTGEYTCTGIDTLQSLADQQIDNFLVYYDPYGLTNADYLSDLANGVSIITLTPVDGSAIIKVPNSYLSGIPSGGTVPYSRVILSADLGPLPESLELASLIQIVSDNVTDVIGNSPTIRRHRIPVVDGVSYEQHALLETNRQIAIQQRTSSYAELARLTDLLAERDARIALLEQALVTVSL